MEKILFIQKFFDNWREVGSVTPSSKFLVKKMLEPVDFARAKVLVELGAGLRVQPDPDAPTIYDAEANARIWMCDERNFEKNVTGCKAFRF